VSFVDFINKLTLQTKHLANKINRRTRRPRFSFQIYNVKQLTPRSAKPRQFQKLIPKIGAKFVPNIDPKYRSQTFGTRAKSSSFERMRQLCAIEMPLSSGLWGNKWLNKQPSQA